MRDFVDRLEFRPATGSITLAGERLVLQRASMNTDLQQQLIRQLGRDDAMAILLRCGFNAGREDAEFVRKTWPNIDIGDAFTAGTRLHMVTGTVRVDTLANDFDFDADRFQAEFEWHDSVEASEHSRRYGQSDQPVCWRQLGYASGYASEFFRKLVIYKEVQCAAMGHSHCRLQGRTSDSWGNDPYAKFFLEKVLLRRKMAPLHWRDESHKKMPEAQSIEACLMAPVQSNLDRLVAAKVGGLITGVQGAGQERVATWFAQALCARTQHPVTISATAKDAEAKIEAWTKGAKNGAFVILNVDLLSPPLLARLATELANPDTRHAPVVATISRPLADVMGDPAVTLFHSLLTLNLDLPSLRQRQKDISDLVIAVFSTLDLGDLQQIEDDALLALTKHEWAGEFAELIAMVRRCALLAVDDVITADVVAQAVSQTRATPVTDGSLWPIIRQQITRDGLKLPDVLGQIYAGAMADSGGNVAAAARVLGMSRAQFAYQLKTTSGTS